MIIACESCGSRNRVPASRLDEQARCAKCKASLAPAHVPIEVNSEQEFDELITQSPLPVVVDFWAEWCAPCRTVAPELQKLAAQKVGQAVVAKVNTEVLPSVARRFRIESIPTMALFRGGKEVRRTSGARPASGIARELGLAEPI
jgi:thioredoxin 2